MNESPGSQDVPQNNVLGSQVVNLKQSPPHAQPKKKKKRLCPCFRKAKKNESPGSQDVRQNKVLGSQDVNLKQSPPHAQPKKKKKRLCPCFRKRKTTKPPCTQDVDLFHSTDSQAVSVHHSAGSQDVDLYHTVGSQDRNRNQSTPHATQNKKKESLCQRFKHVFRSREMKGKPSDDVSHVMNAEPQMTKRSFKKEPLTESKVKAYLESNSALLDAYVWSHASVMHEVLSTYPDVLSKHVEKYVPSVDIMMWLGEKKIFLEVSRDLNKGDDIDLNIDEGVEEGAAGGKILDCLHSGEKILVSSSLMANVGLNESPSSQEISPSESTDSQDISLKRFPGLLDVRPKRYTRFPDVPLKPCLSLLDVRVNHSPDSENVPPKQTPCLLDVRLNHSPDSQDITTTRTQSPPQTTPKEKKKSLWKRFKDTFRRTKNKKMPGDDLSHVKSAEPLVTKQSSKDEQLTDAMVEAYIEDHHPFMVEYFHSHIEFVHTFLCRSSSLLEDHVQKYVSCQKMESWLTEKIAFLNASRDVDEVGDLNTNKAASGGKAALETAIIVEDAADMLVSSSLIGDVSGNESAGSQEISPSESTDSQDIPLKHCPGLLDILLKRHIRFPNVPLKPCLSLLDVRVNHSPDSENVPPKQTPCLLDVQLNHSPDSQDITQNQSPPQTTPKEKKKSLWKRFKDTFRRTKNKEKPGDDLSPVQSADSIVTIQSLKEAQLNDAMVEVHFPDHRPFMVEYFHSPIAMVRLALCRRPIFLEEHVQKHVSFQKTELWFPEKKGVLNISSDIDEGDDIDWNTNQCFEEGAVGGKMLVYQQRTEKATLEKVISWEDTSDFLKELKKLHGRLRHPNLHYGYNDGDEGHGLMKHEEVEENALVGDWRIIAKIAKGIFGFLYKAKNINSSVKATLKKAINLEKAEGLLKEADIMRRLDHKNIVKLINVQEDQQCNQVVLIMEYMTGDPLSHRLAFQKKFSPNLALGIMKQMASAFAYMHSKNIVHRDIKLANMLCNDQLEVKIIDLGLALVSTESKQLYDLSGTQGYMAPEIFFHNSYTGPPADVWSLGILFTQLLIGLEFDGLQIIKMSHDCTAFKVVYNPPPCASESLASLLTAMLLEKPMERLTMEEISNHKCFR